MASSPSSSSSFWGQKDLSSVNCVSVDSMAAAAAVLPAAVCTADGGFTDCFIREMQEIDDDDTTATAAASFVVVVELLFIFTSSREGGREGEREWWMLLLNDRHRLFVLQSCIFLLLLRLLHISMRVFCTRSWMNNEKRINDAIYTSTTTKQIVNKSNCFVTGGLFNPACALPCPALSLLSWAVTRQPKKDWTFLYQYSPLSIKPSATDWMQYDVVLMDVVVAAAVQSRCIAQSGSGIIRKKGGDFSNNKRFWKLQRESHSLLSLSLSLSQPPWEW